MDRPENIVQSGDLAWKESSRNGRLQFRRKSLGRASGGSKLGCSLYDVPAGGRLWPYHFHYGNEEAVYILEGEGKVRLPEGEFDIGPGDYIALPPGHESAHRVMAGPDGPLRCLIFSTMLEPDISGYPDSGKLGLFAGSAPGGRQDAHNLRLFLQPGKGVDYWEGEK